MRDCCIDRFVIFVQYQINGPRHGQINNRSILKGNRNLTPFSNLSG